MNGDLYIVGTGGLSREILEMLSRSNLKDYNFVGFISKNKSEIGKWLGCGQVVGSDNQLPFRQDEEQSIIIGLGHPGIRNRVARKYNAISGCLFPNLIDDTARISESAILGMGNVLSFNSFISTDVTIGDFNLINWFSSVGHDSKIGTGCVINPHSHLSGFSKVENNVLIGAGASVLEFCSICSDTLIAAGAVVNKDIVVPDTYLGVPARVK